MTNKKKVRNN